MVIDNYEMSNDNYKGYLVLLVSDLKMENGDQFVGDNEFKWLLGCKYSVSVMLINCSTSL